MFQNEWASLWAKAGWCSRLTLRRQIPYLVPWWLPSLSSYLEHLHSSPSGKLFPIDSFPIAKPPRAVDSKRCELGRLYWFPDTLQHLLSHTAPHFYSPGHSRQGFSCSSALDNESVYSCGYAPLLSLHSPGAQRSLHSWSSEEAERQQQPGLPPYAQRSVQL